MFSLPKLATVDAVARRSGEDPDELEDLDIELIELLIDIVSADVRGHGQPWPDPVLAPDIVKATVVKAAARGFMNLSGYQLERGDMLTLQRTDLFSDGETLSAAEIAAIRRIAAQNGIHSMPMEREVMLAGTFIGDERGDLGA